MANWSDVYTGIGLLGQTKKGMYDPLRQAAQNRGRMWQEGFGKISDTFQNIANKKFQSGEAEKGRVFQAGEAEKQRDFVTSEREASFKPVWQEEGFDNIDEWMSYHKGDPIWKQYGFDNIDEWKRFQKDMASIGINVNDAEDNLAIKFGVYLRQLKEEHSTYFQDPQTGLPIGFLQMSPDAQTYLVNQWSSQVRSDPDSQELIDMFINKFESPTQQSDTLTITEPSVTTKSGGQFTTPTHLPEGQAEAAVKNSAPYTSLWDFFKRQGLEAWGNIKNQVNEFMDDLDKLGVSKIYKTFGENEAEATALDTLSQIRRTLSGADKETVAKYIAEIGGPGFTPQDRLNQLIELAKKLQSSYSESLPSVGSPVIGTEIQFH